MLKFLFLEKENNLFPRIELVCGKSLNTYRSSSDVTNKIYENLVLHNYFENFNEYEIMEMFDFAGWLYVTIMYHENPEISFPYNRIREEISKHFIPFEKRKIVRYILLSYIVLYINKEESLYQKLIEQNCDLEKLFNNYKEFKTIVDDNFVFHLHMDADNMSNIMLFLNEHGAKAIFILYHCEKDHFTKQIYKLNVEKAIQKLIEYKQNNDIELERFLYSFDDFIQYEKKKYVLNEEKFRELDSEFERNDYTCIAIYEKDDYNKIHANVENVNSELHDVEKLTEENDQLRKEIREYKQKYDTPFYKYVTYKNIVNEIAKTRNETKRNELIDFFRIILPKSETDKFIEDIESKRNITNRQEAPRIGSIHANQVNIDSNGIKYQ